MKKTVPETQHRFCTQCGKEINKYPICKWDFFDRQIVFVCSEECFKQWSCKQDSRVMKVLAKKNAQLDAHIKEDL